MDVSSATSTQAAAPSAKPQSSQAAISADFETFLTMLTAQMENQDPLNPMESTDLSVQLATFSGVEQQVLTNDLLENVSAALGLDGMSQYAGWIGKEARVAAPVSYTGQPVTLNLNPTALADEAVLIVTNDVGAEVQRVPVDTAPGPYNWTGLQTNGIPLVDGAYTLELESLADGAPLSREKVETYQKITETRLGDAGVELVLRGGTTVLASDATALRDTQP